MAKKKSDVGAKEAPPKEEPKADESAEKEEKGKLKITRGFKM